MRNYIILNDINSNTINGLLIQELPPISKPKMRTRTEEIDGRAGDIVTQLGFKAYDKTIKIGLYGDFDINEVISYFNSSGQVVFSNEPDKYYNYQIVDQIDYERLIRFRTAKVKMHVQPFKYPTEEEPLVGQYQYVTNTGSNMSLDNTANALFKKFDLKGNTSQDGTPTPSSPIPVNVVSGDNEINICGKNLLDINNYLEAYTNGNTGQVISISDARCYWCRVQPNQTYTFSRDKGDRLMILGGNTQPIIGSTMSVIVDDGNSTATSKTFTNGNYEYILIYSSRTSENRATSVMVEKGSTATTYEPYIGNTYPISLGSVELCKIGTYQDYIYKDNGSWYLHKEIGKVVLDSNKNWNYISVAQGSLLRSDNSILDAIINTTVVPYSNYYRGIPLSQSGSRTNNDLYINNATNYSYIDIIDNRHTNATDFKTWLSNNNVILYYVLATPTDISIEDTTLLEQLEEIKSANSYEGQTNINHDSNDAPFLVDVSAVQSGTDELVVDNEGNIYSRPTLDLEGTGIVNVYLEGNQMFQVDLTDTNEIVIDTDEMEAYNPTTQALMNRQVTGNYDNFKLNVGDNTLKFSGDLTKATITGYVRWL